MFNILLEEPPQEVEGYPINSDFRTGLQISQALTDPDLTTQEKSYVACYLLYAQSDEYGEENFPPSEVMGRGIAWFMTGWVTDNHSEGAKKRTAPVMDMEVDQWRIYSAFLSQYSIDLSKTRMHYWTFMGLLTTLEECAFTRVVDIRTKDLSTVKNPELKKFYQKNKAIYSLNAKYDQETPEERAEREAADAAFLAKLKINRH